MDDFIDRFEKQLRRAHRPRTARLPLGRPALAALGVLAVAAPAMALTQPWNPELGDRPGTGRPVATSSLVPEVQRNALEVLRREQTEEDRGAQTQAGLRFLRGGLRGVRTDAIRLLRATGPAAGTVLIPVTEYGGEDPGVDTTHWPEGLKRLYAAKPDGLCVFIPEPEIDGGGLACQQLSEIQQPHNPPTLGSVAYDLVPDKVTTVRLTVGGRRRTIEAPVRDNFFAADLDADGAFASGCVTRVEWVNADGAVVATWPG